MNTTPSQSVSAYQHPQIVTCVQCDCGRGWAKRGVTTPRGLWALLHSDGWSHSDGIGTIYCPVCNGRQTAEDYKAGKPVR